VTTDRQPLSRFRVLDLTRVRAGPTAVRQLADWGADVIKIEMPAGPEIDDGFTGERDSPDFQNLHRNKRSMTLNLKAEEGKEIFRRLVVDADVVVENYRPDVKNRLGIDFESLRKINPGIVLGSISGFGQDGPYRDRPGVDQIAQGMGGLMSVTGLPGQGPVRAGTAIADLTSGLYLAIAILTALLQREETGEGRWVHTSLLEAQIAIMDFQAARWLMGHEVPVQAGNNHPTAVPTGVYPTSDGHINIGSGGGERWVRLCKAIGAEHLLEDPDYAGRSQRSENRDALNEILSEFTRTRTSAEWVKLLNDSGVPCGPIYTLDQTFEDPQVRHLGMAKGVDHARLGAITLVGQPINFDGVPERAWTGTPELGEHTDKVLAELGYDSGAIADLRQRAVI
jgi:formyl-CoA transferase